MTAEELNRRFWLKFLLDRLVAALCMPGLLLASALVALGMAVEAVFFPATAGPLFYWEERWTQGRTFWIIKFRTTYCGSQDPGEVGRLTRLGNVIRNYYLDELPQVFNVLRGEMTLVGPRPNVPWKARREIEDEGMRSKALLRAGLTGMVQVHKGDAQDRSVYRRLEDRYLEEVQRCTPLQIVLLDLRLLRQTLPFMLRGEGF